MKFFKKDTNVIAYTIDKSFSGNVAISVQDGQVAVSAPWYVSRKTIEQIISEKKNWISQKLKEYEEINKIKKANMEKRTIKVFGEDYSLKISYKLIQAPEVNLENKSLRIDLPVKYKSVDNNKVLNFIIEKFYAKLAENEIEGTMEKIRLILGISPEDYRVEKMDGVLGKYNEIDRSITINPDIVKFDRQILEYVTLHEFCHLSFKTHCRSFYNLIEKNMKNYKDIEKMIKGMF